MRLHNIQALRAVAALMVVATHLPRLEARAFPNGLVQWVGAGGATGVDLFFVISGCIMVVTTWNSFGRSGAGPMFLARRALRIYPLFWIMLTIYIALAFAAPLLLHMDPQRPWDVIASYLLIPHSIDNISDVAWSLSFEMYFYLVFAGALFFRRGALLWISVGWIATMLVCALLSPHVMIVAIRFIAQPLSLEFMLGMIVGALVMQRRLYHPRLLFALAVVAVVAVAGYSTRFDGFGTTPLQWYRAVVVAPAMALLLYGAVGLEERFGRVAPVWLRRIGDASYSMYLWHGFALAAWTALVLRLHPHGVVADIAYIAGAFVVVVIVSRLVYWAIERPLIHAFAGLGRAAPERAAEQVAPAVVAPARVAVAEG